MKPYQFLTILFLLPLAAWAQRAPTYPDSADDVYELDDYLVVGSQVDNYRAAEGLSGMKVPIAQRDLPFVVNVVSRQLIEDRAIRSLGEALDNVPGVQRKHAYAGKLSAGGYIRGFDNGTYSFRNGFRDHEFYTIRDPANIERFEVLKGPASIIYGFIQPGGITNTISKKPVTQPLRRVSAVIGDFDSYRGEIDLGGPLSQKVFYRLNLAVEDSESFRDHVTDRSQFIAPVVTWVISDKTRLTIEAEYKHSDFTWDSGLPRGLAAFDLPISRFVGEPYAVNDIESVFGSAILEHQISDNWKFRQNIAAAYTGGNYKIVSPGALAADGRTLSRTAYDDHEASENYTLQWELLGEFDLGPTKHQTAFGLDFTRSVIDFGFFSQIIAPIDIYEPVYGAQPSWPPIPFIYTYRRNHGAAVFLQDMISLGEKWKILLGARYDSVYVRIDDPVVTLRRSYKGTNAKVVPQAGIVYQPTSTTSLYASYSTSFDPITSGRKEDGSYLEPETGEQYEVGIKQDLFGGRATATVSAFWIVKENVSTAHPTIPRVSIQTGEQKSEGVEFELVGGVFPGLDVSLGGAYIDAYVSRDNTIPVGSIRGGASKLSGNIWAKYTVQSGSIKGLGFGLGAYSASKSKTSLPNQPWWIPSYTRLDAMVSYTWEQWQFQVNVNNLRDDKIYSHGGSIIMPQPPRNFRVSVRYSF